MAYFGPNYRIPQFSFATPRKRERTEEIPISPYVTGMHLLTQGYKDNASGNYGGTANAVLTNPISWCSYLIQSNDYGNQSIVGSSAFGSFTDARAGLDQWAAWGERVPDSTKTWSSTAILQRQESIEADLVALTNHLPGVRFSRDSSGLFRAFVWVPGEEWPTSQLYGSGTPIDIEEFLLANDEGADIQVWQGDSSEVLNDFSVRYHHDPGSGDFTREAKLNRLGSDDGYGKTWGGWLGITGANIAAWSHGLFGEKVAEPIELYGITDPDIAVAIGSYHFWRLYRPQVYLQMRVTLGMADMMPGHIFRLSDTLQSRFGLYPQFWGTATSGTYEHADWESIYWLCSYADTTGTGFRSRTIRATWIPRTFGNEVGAGAGQSGEVGVGGSLSEEI